MKRYILFGVILGIAFYFWLIYFCDMVSNPNQPIKSAMTIDQYDLPQDSEIYEHPKIKGEKYRQ